MSQWNAVKRTYQMARKLHQQRGGFTILYFADGIYCGYRHCASPENYFVLRFYELSNKERAQYLTSGRSSKADRELNRMMTKEENRIMSNKHLLYQKFQKGMRRSYLFVPEATYEEFDKFLDENQIYILKPDKGIMGQGIQKIYISEVKERRALYEKCKRENFLVEQVIKQHEVLEQICPGCINSVRINAARDQKGKVRLIGACLKCGGLGAVADNFHSGGLAYPVEMETGKVTGPGRNNTDLTDYVRHPNSEIYMPGLQIPYWKNVKEYALQAMECMPNLGYVGWDIAVTLEGPEIIEGNCHWPGGNIIQFDNEGKYPLVKECLEEDKCRNERIF